MIEFKCPHCQHLLNLPDDWAGEQSTCTRCGIPFTVPGGRAVAANEDIWADLHGQRQADAPSPYSPRTPHGEYQPRTARLSHVQAPAERPPLQSDPSDVTPDDVPDWVATYETKTVKRLGPLFWFLAYFMPPVAIVWALTLPPLHPQKKIALAMPVIWFGMISSVGVLAAIVGPAISESLQPTRAAAPQTQSDPAFEALQEQAPQRTSKSAYPRLDVNFLEIGKVYRVMKQTPFYNQPGGSDGIEGIGSIQMLPAGGMFRILRAVFPGQNPWYQVTISDGRNDHTRWIHYKDLVGRDVHVISEPNLPVLPLPR